MFNLIRATDLAQAHQSKIEKRKQCFDHILDRCCKYIKRHAENEHSMCFYEVPEFLLGYPLYDLNECISHLYGKLAQNGFQVQYFFPRIILIAWQLPRLQTSLTLTHEQSANQISDTGTGSVGHSVGAIAENRRHPPARAKVIVSPRGSRGGGRKGRNARVATSITAAAAVPTFARSIAEFKPSGKFVLNLT